MTKLAAWSWTSVALLVAMGLAASPARADEPGTGGEPTYLPDAWFPSEPGSGATPSEGPTPDVAATSDVGHAGAARDDGGTAADAPAAAPARSHGAYERTRERRERRHRQPPVEVDAPARAGGITLAALGGASLLMAAVVAVAPSGPFDRQSHSNESVRTAFILGGVGVVLGAAGIVVINASSRPGRSVAVGVGAGSMQVDGTF